MDSSISRAPEPKEYTPAEEVANSVTHAAGLALSIAALSVLVTLAAAKGDAWRVVSFSIYGATLVMLYLASTCYHAVPGPRSKRVLRVVDHAAIYLLIAGTYTPFALVSLRGPWGWTIFGVIWGLALIGIVLKVFSIGRSQVFGVGVYIAMGWFILVALKPALAAVPLGGMVWLTVGGCAYTFGTIFYAWKRLPHHHAIWHLFVLTGSVCHFFAVLFYVLPFQPGG